MNYGKGKLTKVLSTVSATENREFDNFGRLKATAQITDGQTYTSGFTYNLSGALIQETYPSGRTVVNEFESDGDLGRIASKKAAETVYHTYVNDFLYTASGGISRMKLGNGKWETATFNTRLQVTQLGLGTSAADTSTWRINYEYGELNQDGSVDAAKNTGNIAKQTLSFSGLTYPMVQAFRYDSLYRLTEAKETANGSQNWIQTWTYDRYGNRATFTQNVGGNTNVWNPTVDANTNRFLTSQGFLYDKNGNVTTDVDPITNHARQFTFNGDNKQIEVKDLSTNLVKGQYFYDGEGKRVKKINPETNEVTVFVYSAGKLVAEYSTAAPQSNPSVNFTTTDHLGSPRVITNELGHVTSRRDFLPFGEELYVNIGGRTTDQHYGSSTDNVRQKFTGYQKDTETSLDFAEARMYENRFGRFTAVDPLMSSATVFDPQSFDRYTYVMNDPINFSDPSGLCAINGKEDGLPCKNYSGQVFRNKDGSFSSSDVDGGSPYNGPAITRQFYGVDYRIIGGTNGGWYQMGPSLSTVITGGPSALMGDAPTTIATTIESRPLLSLPCPVGETCGGGSSPPSLDMSHNEPLRAVEGIAQLAEVGQLIPGLNIPFALVSATVRTGQGNFGDAGVNLAMAVPFAKNLRMFGKGAVVAEEGLNFTRSSLTRGQEVHKLYKASLADKINTFKEYGKIKGIRPDFVDFNTKTIYELKPFNPRGMRSGQRQLQRYKDAFEREFGGEWNTILDFY